MSVVEEEEGLAFDDPAVPARGFRDSESTESRWITARIHFLRFTRLRFTFTIPL